MSAPLATTFSVFNASSNTYLSDASCNPYPASSTCGSINSPAAWTASTSSTLNAQYFLLFNGNSTFEVVNSWKETVPSYAFIATSDTLLNTTLFPSTFVGGVVNKAATLLSWNFAINLASHKTGIKLVTAIYIILSF